MIARRRLAGSRDRGPEDSSHPRDPAVPRAGRRSRPCGAGDVAMIDHVPPDQVVAIQKHPRSRWDDMPSR